MIIRRDFQQMTPEHWEAKKGIPSASNAGRIITSVGKRCVLPSGHTGQCVREVDTPCSRTVVYMIRKKTKEMTCILPRDHDGDCFGKLPASDARCAKTIPQLSEAADAYIAELIAETVTQLPNYFTTQGHPIRRPFSNEHTENGIDLEAEARAAFAMDSGEQVEQVGWCVDEQGRWGFSPDGLIVGKQAGLELKCPALHTQAQYLLAKTLPREYKPQVHFALAVSGYDFWWFYSYSPPLDPLMLKVYPDEYTEAMKSALEQFHGRYMEARAKLLGGAA